MNQPLQQQLVAGLAQLQIEVSPSQQQALLHYLDLLSRWNQVYNLTAVRDPVDMLTRHIFDSLAAYQYIDSSPILDLGTGAGVPGVPLAIVYPEFEFLLLDSRHKKTRFVQHVIATLRLTHVSVVTTRIEDFKPSQQFSYTLARALADLTTLWSYSQRFLKSGGSLLAFKSSALESELSALTAVGIAYQQHQLQVPYLDATRYLIQMTNSL
jgi:16S rRNA (guanine527-N7)-methyltransferase